MAQWQFSHFSELTCEELYAILGARAEVFVLEQTCLYRDIDGHDPCAHHLMGWRTSDGQRELLAYLRVLAPGTTYPEASIGRVLTTPAGRGIGVGRELMARAVAHAQRLYPGQHIRIGAQAYLKDFYESFGFRQVGEPYVEDGIPHLEMLRS